MLLERETAGVGGSSSEESSEDRGLTGGLVGSGFRIQGSFDVGRSVEVGAGVGICAVVGVVEGTGAVLEAKMGLDRGGIRAGSGSESESGAGSGTGLGERFWIRVEERGAMREGDG